MRTPIKVNGERVLAGPAWRKSLVAQTYMNPQTNEIYEYGIFKVDYPPCVTVFPVTDGFDVVAIRQYRHAADKFLLELPGGISESGGNSRDDAERELDEETGCIAGKITMLNELPIYFDPASLTLSFNSFLAQNCKQISGPRLDRNENIEVMRMPIDDWLHRIGRGEVRDAKSIATTFLAVRALGMK